MSRTWQLPGGTGPHNYDQNLERASRIKQPAGLAYSTSRDCLISGSPQDITPTTDRMYLFPMRVLSHPIGLSAVRIRTEDVSTCQIAIYRRDGLNNIALVPGSVSTFTPPRNGLYTNDLEQNVELQEGVEYFIAFCPGSGTYAGYSAYDTAAVDLPVIRQTTTGYSGLIGPVDRGTLDLTFTNPPLDGSLLVCSLGAFSFNSGHATDVSMPGVTWQTPQIIGQYDDGGVPSDEYGNNASWFTYAYNIQNAGSTLTFDLGGYSRYQGIALEITGVRTDTDPFIDSIRYGTTAFTGETLFIHDEDKRDFSTLSTTETKGICLALTTHAVGGAIDGNLEAPDMQTISEGLARNLTGYTPSASQIQPQTARNSGAFTYYRTFDQALDNEFITFFGKNYVPPEGSWGYCNHLVAFAAPDTVTTSNAAMAIPGVGHHYGTDLPGTLDIRNTTKYYLSDTIGIPSITYLSREGASLL